MPRSFHRNLHDSRFSVDWPMIVVGWHGFGSHKLSAEQVTSFALELIGNSTPEQDETAALLANTDPSEWQTIDRYSTQVAEAEPFEKNMAIRRWRQIELRSLIEAILPEEEFLRSNMEANMSILEIGLTPEREQRLRETARAGSKGLRAEGGDR